MSSRPFFLLPLCFVSALALNAYAALDPTGVYQDYLEKLDAATPPVAAMATAAADGVYPWSEPKAPEPPPVPDPAPLPDPEPEPEPEAPDSPFTTVDASYFDAVSYTHLRAHETDQYLVCRLLLEKKKI